jgi:hypothetical protein
LRGRGGLEVNLRVCSWLNQRPSVNGSTYVSALSFSFALFACASPLPPERQSKLEGLSLYGLVNLDPSAELTARARRTVELTEHCTRSDDAWCSDLNGYTFVNLLLMNTYTGGLRSVGSFVPIEQQVRRGDIVAVRFRAGTTAQFIRIASRGETPACRWEGGGVGRALTAAGVICEEYDWRHYRGYFYR